MLVGTSRDKGQHPCPHCLITFDDIPEIGTPSDRERRQTLTRANQTADWQSCIRQAQNLIYEHGYVVNSDRVDQLLKGYSYVPTVVSSLSLLFSTMTYHLPEFICGAFGRIWV